MQGLGGSTVGGLQKNLFTDVILPIATITAPIWGPQLGSLITPNNVAQSQSTQSPATTTTNPSPQPSSNNALYLMVGGVAVLGILFFALHKSRK